MFVTAYSDGSSRGNPGPGGYGSVLLYTDPSGKTHTLELSQGYRRTTNNRMELMGAIVALEALKRPCTVELHTDSKYRYNERCDQLATAAADGSGLMEDAGFTA